MSGVRLRVLIRCDAGRRHGLGHLARCATLARALCDIGASPTLLVGGDFDRVEEFASNQGLDIEPVTFQVGEPDDVEFLAGRVAAEVTATVLVLDSREMDGSGLEPLTKVAPVVCIDDDLLRDLPCDLLINPHPGVAPDAYPHRSGRRILAGAEFNFIAPAYFASRAGRSVRGAPERVLITMGGEDPWDCTSYLLGSCADVLATCSVTVVVGPAHPSPAAVREAAKRLPDIELVVAPSRLDELIARCDVALSAGGTTCYELAAAGVPMGVVALEPHQTELVEILVQAGSALPLGGPEPPEAEVLAGKVEALSSDSVLRVRLSDAAATMFSAPGAPQVAEVLCKLVSKD